MSDAIVLSREERRLEALRRYEILDTPPEEAFDEVARLAARICDAPIAVVNLIDDGRQFFKAEVGLGVRSTPLETSFCATAILEEDFLVIPDATKDHRFNCNPLVTAENGLRFYAGALLKTAEGLPIGTLCVLDTRPRNLGDLERDALRTLANQVMAQLELRLALKTRADAEARHSAIVESVTDYAIVATDLAGHVTEWNSGAEHILGWSEEEMLGQSADRFFTPADRAEGVVEQEMTAAASYGRGMDERWHLRKNGERFWASGEMMPLYKQGDILIGYIKILRDRTYEKLRADRLAASETRLLASQKAGRIGTFELDIASGRMSVTPEFCAIFGVPVADHHSAAEFEALVFEEDRHIPSNVATRSDGRAITDVEYRIRRADDGAIRWVSRRAEFAVDEDGRTARMFGTIQDITQRKRSQIKVAALLEMGDRLRDAEDLGAVFAASAAILGRTLGGQRAGYALIDLQTGTFTVEHAWVSEGAENWTGVHGLHRFSATVAALSPGGALVVEDSHATVELASDRATYQRMDTRSQIMVPLFRRGELVGVLFVHNRDVRKWTGEEISFARNVADRTYAAVAALQAEADQVILNEELSHRLKNTLAMVQAIATQTLRNVTERDAVEALTSRIIALSTAHDILLQDKWRAAQMHQIASAVLALHAEPDQVEVVGPPIGLSPRAGLSVSLLLSELATNAAKYGSLSEPRGRVRVEWNIANIDGRPLLTLTWTEAGGPAVIEPSQKGFGSRLIQMGLVGTRQTELDFAPSGLIARFTAPLSLLQHD